MTKIYFEHWSKDESKDQWSTFIIKFSKKIPDGSKNKHDEDLENIPFETIRTDDAKKQDKGEKNPVRNFQNLNPKGNERKVKN